MNKPGKGDSALLSELRGLIEQARGHVAQTANSTLTILYWRIGRRIGVELLKEERAPYGQEIVSAVSRELNKVPEREALRARLHRAIELARQQALTALPFAKDRGEE